MKINLHPTFPFILAGLIFTPILNGCVVQERAVIQTSPRAYPSKPHHAPPKAYNYRFSDRERYEFNRYYHPNSRNKHHSKPIPPGHYKRPYQLHKPLPANLRYQPLPPDLRRRLPPPPRDMIRIRIGGDLLLINPSTRIVYDIIFNF